MFGYVTIYKDDLKISEYNVFRAYYCGLCREIGRCSQAARLGLSYDMTFLSILLSSLSENPLKTEMKRCIAHPLSKRAVAAGDKACEYSAHMSILLTYLKFADDWRDDKSISALCGMGVYFSAMRKIRKLYPEQYERIIAGLNNLDRLEKENCASADESADCFANILSALFTPPFVKDEAVNRALSWLGYNIGRWIYLLDAYNDIDRDVKKKNYNPFLASYSGGSAEKLKETLKENLSVTMTYTLSAACSAYELLPIQKNDAVLRNILYFGLKSRQDAILKGKAGTPDEPV